VGEGPLKICKLRTLHVGRLFGLAPASVKNFLLHPLRCNVQTRNRALPYKSCLWARFALPAAAFHSLFPRTCADRRESLTQIAPITPSSAFSFFSRPVFENVYAWYLYEVLGFSLCFHFSGAYGYYY
jgi:hypothetical protein